MLLLRQSLKEEYSLLVTVPPSSLMPWLLHIWERKHSGANLRVQALIEDFRSCASKRWTRFSKIVRVGFKRSRSM